MLDVRGSLVESVSLTTKAFDYWFAIIKKGEYVNTRLHSKMFFDLWQTQTSIQTTRRNQKSKACDHSQKHRMIHYAYKSTQHKLNMKNAENQQLGRPTVNPGRPKMKKNPYTSARSTHRPFRSTQNEEIFISVC